MSRNVLVCIFAAVCLCIAGVVVADNGPAEMVLQAEKDKAKKPKPAVFPHAKHQEIATCADCHHSAQDGKKVDYVEGLQGAGFQASFWVKVCRPMKRRDSRFPGIWPTQSSAIVSAWWPG